MEYIPWHHCTLCTYPRAQRMLLGIISSSLDVSASVGKQYLSLLGPRSVSLVTCGVQRARSSPLDFNPEDRSEGEDAGRSLPWNVCLSRVSYSPSLPVPKQCPTPGRHSTNISKLHIMKTFKHTKSVRIIEGTPVRPPLRSRCHGCARSLRRHVTWKRAQTLDHSTHKNTEDVSKW